MAEHDIESLIESPVESPAESPGESPIVSVAELAAHLGHADWVVVDCRFNLMDPAAGRAAWRAGHVPGAYYADLDTDLAAPVADDGAGGRHPLPDAERFNALLRRWGVHDSTRVVAYDDVGNAVAARLWWLLRWAGHRRPAVLDGGFPAWQAAGQPVTADESPAGDGSFAVGAAALPVVEATAVGAGIAARDMVLIDARAAERFAGRVEPLDKRAGHVPGAVNAPFQHNLTTDKCFRAPAELRAYYRAALGDGGAAGRVACMCGSGVTACHTLLALELAGMPGAALYTGSWSDWISDDSRPIATADESQGDESE